MIRNINTYEYGFIYWLWFRMVAKKVSKKVKKKIVLTKAKKLANASIPSKLVNSKKKSDTISGPIKRNDLLGDIISKYPEVTPVLAQSGLHCIGCHVSVSESLEDGCSVHGMNNKEIDELVESANKRINEFEVMPKVTFTKNAVLELIKRKTVSNKKYVKIVNSFGGEFDFDTSDTKEEGEVLVAATSGGEVIEILLFAPIERMLRGVEIDYDSKLKDFAAKRK